MRKLILFCLVLLPLTCYPTAAQTSCIGAPGNEPEGGSYSEQRIFLESQVWWVNTGLAPFAAGTNYGHIHLGLCFPYKQTVDGLVLFNLRIILHNSTGIIKTLRISDGSNIKWKKSVSLSCASSTCTWWFPVLFNTTTFDYDGRREFRFTADIPVGGFPDSNARMYQSTGWQAYLMNGKPIKNYRTSDVTIGRGWYTDSDYSNAQVKADLPLTPISGNFATAVNFTQNVTQCDVLLDPDFHATPPVTGTLLFEGQTKSSCQETRTISIDTTTLSNGVHRLVLRAKLPVIFNGQVVLKMGIQMVPFVVQN